MKVLTTFSVLLQQHVCQGRHTCDKFGHKCSAGGSFARTFLRPQGEKCGASFHLRRLARPNRRRANTYAPRQPKTLRNDSNLWFYGCAQGCSPANGVTATYGVRIGAPFPKERVFLDSKMHEIAMTATRVPGGTRPVSERSIDSSVWRGISPVGTSSGHSCNFRIWVST